ncbi:MAG TPA: pitrilysin family protein [Thermoanaerobaculia bacterium]|nr:pitrilysin family protein [Thermoanaerobaculia bacterium]
MKLLTMGVILLTTFGCTTAPDVPPPAPVPQAAAVPAPQPAAYMAGEPRVTTVDSRAPLVTIRVMVTRGSASDPAGKEGLASMVADMITDGGYRGAGGIVTKEQLAEMTMPWGSAARPSGFASTRATTYYFSAPRELAGRYVQDILRPMLNEPVFEADELERLKTEHLSSITQMRTTNLEALGLAAVDSVVFDGTPYEHHFIGTETAIPTFTRDDIIAFYRAHYRPENIIVGISSTDEAIVSQVREAVRSINRDATTASPALPAVQPAPFSGRHALVIEEPNAPAASVHLGFPIAVNRGHEDYWPLYVANLWLGTHRDSFGQLYQKIREERGYNYGDYAYIEHWDGRPASLFQLFNQPREQQYFSIWVRPVKHEHAVHLMKAVTYELEEMVREGLSAEDVASAKNKARVLYLNLAETVPRLVSARVDDVFYGLQDRGFLDSYLQSIDRVTVEQVNAAIRRHLRPDNIKYVVVTSTPFVQPTVAQIRSDQPVYGKSFAEYEFTQAKLADGTTVWQIPEAKVPTVQLDAAWAHYPLNVRDVSTEHVQNMFK